MRVVVLMLGAALVGALLTYLLVEDSMESAVPDPATSTATGAAAGESDGARRVRTPTPLTADGEAKAPELKAREGSRPPEVKVHGTAGISVSTKGAVDTMQMIKEVQKAFSAKLHERDARIKQLEGEIERRNALPKPEVVQALETASVHELMALAGEIRCAAEARLLTPPPHLEEEYSGLLQDRNAGTARLLVRGKYDTLVSKRGGGAYWSFVTRSNSYNEEPDLELQSGHYSTGFAGGDHGYLMDLGNIPIASVYADPDRPPVGLDEQGLEQWAYLWKAAEAERAGRRPDRRRIPGKNPGLESRVEAVVGHTYLLRAILFGDHDILVVFRTAESDEHGHSLVWRILKQWDMPSRR